MGLHLTESVYKVHLHKSITAQIRQLIRCYALYTESVDDFLWESTFAKRLYEHLL